jgi:hypothetical protein
MKDFINGRNVPGIAELKVDVNKGKPAMSVRVDREKQVEWVFRQVKLVPAKTFHIWRESRNL